MEADADSPDVLRAKYLENSAARRRVYVLPRVFTSEQCAALRKAVARAASEHGGWQTDRHAAYSTTDLPAISLPSKALCFVERHVTRSALAHFARLHGFEASDVYVKDLFFVRYFCGEAGAQTALEMHSDGCLFSFNIVLSPPGSFDGGGTEFAHLGPAGAIIDAAPTTRAQDVDAAAAERLRARGGAGGATVRVGEGDLVMHDGAVRHAGHGITRGERLLLVGFCEAVRSPMARVARERATGVRVADAVLALQLEALDKRLTAQAARRRSGGAESQVLEDAMALLYHGAAAPVADEGGDDARGDSCECGGELARVADDAREVIWEDDWSIQPAK